MSESREQEKLYELMSQNALVWGKHYCGKHFGKETPMFHLKILDAVLKSKFFAAAAPRGSAKSTIANFLYIAHCIAFKKKRHVVLVQNTYAKAAGSLATIKSEFKDNELLKNDFKVSFSKDSEGDTVFRHPDGFETRVLCKGAEQIGSVRGEKFKAYRPDLIVVDDLEDDELCRSLERRNKLKDDFDNALIPAGDVDRLQVIVIGTILHDDSLMAKLVSRETYLEYRKLLFKARYDKNGGKVSLWPQKWTVEALDAMEAEKPDVFAKEMQNDPVSGARAKFNKDDFRYWRIENNRAVLSGKESEVVSTYNLRDCVAAIACDLAFSERRESDFTAIMPGFLTPGSDLLLDTYICKRGMKPDEIEEILFSMEERLRMLTGKSVYIGFEKANLEKIMKHLLKDAMRRRNRFLLFKDLMWDNDKITRIVTRLQPRYAQNTIYHRHGMGEYESQLLRIPSGTHDDLPDCAQGLAQLLQYTPSAAKPAQPEDNFKFWQKQTPLWRNKQKTTYVFGQGKKLSYVPTKIGI